jgi:hypothetical protein
MNVNFLFVSFQPNPGSGIHPEPVRSAGSRTSWWLSRHRQVNITAKQDVHVKLLR